MAGRRGETRRERVIVLLMHGSAFPPRPHAQIEEKKHEEEVPEILSLQLSPAAGAGVEPRALDRAVRCSPHVGITPIKCVCVCVQEDTCMHSPPAPRQRPCMRPVGRTTGLAAWELTRRHLRGGRTTTTGETRFDAQPAGCGCLCSALLCSARPCEYFTARPRPRGSRCRCRCRCM